MAFIKVLELIAVEIGISASELQDETVEFQDLGVDLILAKSISRRLQQELQLSVPPDVFFDNATVNDLQVYLEFHDQLGPVPEPSRPAASNNITPSVQPRSVKAGPLSLVLQGTPATCKTTLFMLPDGSGTAMAYGRLRVGADICVIALNSPYLREPPTTSFTVQGIAEVWVAEIQRRQPHGPYLLSGWSAGGYYSYECAKLLTVRGEKISKLILIDSPCRLQFEALPMEVVTFLSSNGLMGNFDAKKVPQWLIDHFAISIRAIEHYMPGAMVGHGQPEVFLIWAKEGVIKRDAEMPGLDLSVKVTDMLIRRPICSGALGWDALFPGARVQWAPIGGNHFTLVHPPYVESLALLIEDAVRRDADESISPWTMVLP
jgi:thioesterase domain-containing protein